MKGTILDLQCRDNFSGIPEAAQDNPEEAIKEFMHSSLKLPMINVNTINFHLVHQIGQRRTD